MKDEKSSQKLSLNRPNKSRILGEKKYVLMKSALFPMLIMLVVWAFIGISPFGNKSLMAVDFGQQYISFYAFLKETVLSGNLTSFVYSFTKSIGGEMIGIFSYYLLSPFNLVYIITPLSHFNIAIFLTIWLRYGMIGLSFAYLLIKRYKGLDNRVWLVPIISTAYALSGMLVSYQMNPIFYDAMIMLPLVIVALEELLDGGKPFHYILVLAITVMLQFYMGYMICLFVALYACYYVSPRLSFEGSWRQKVWHYFIPLLRAFAYSLLGIALVSILLYPVILNLLQSKGQIYGGMQFSIDPQINPLDILSKLVIGGFDTTSGWAKGPNLPNIFIGSVSLVGFFLYFKTPSVHFYHKVGAGVISLVFFISFVNEFMSKIWHMGQNPAGFFYRFSWIFSFFMLILAYQSLKEQTKLSRKGFISGLIIILSSSVYIWGREYTYISLKQPTVFTDIAKEISYNFYVPLLVVIILSTIFIWYRMTKPVVDRLIIISVLVLIIFVSILLLRAGYLFSQISLTIISYILILLVFYFPYQHISRYLIIFVSILELGYNAYLSQVTMNYADAYKFEDATTSVKRVTDTIQENSDVNFYRIGSSFAYSKTVPTLISYPGLSNFSSSLERSTINLFSYLGDIGVNAATQYANGTILTDSLYGVRYYMDLNDSTTLTEEQERMTFTRFSRRFDIPKYYKKTVYADSRYVVYENPDVFSVAFGTNKFLQNIKFGHNNPVANQNMILNTMEGNEKNKVRYFKGYSFSEIEIENMRGEVDSSGQKVFNRIDKGKPGIIRYKVVPKTDYTYYFLTPYSLKDTRGKVSILLNGQWFTNQQTYAQRQLWQLTSNTKGKETVLEFRFSTDDVNMSGAGLIRSDNDAIETVLANRKAQGMTVTKWENTRIEGRVDITDESNVMMTTIPYSSGWTVKVDGKTVKTKKAWDSLLSFPISKGSHHIEMSFFPDGLLKGIIFTFVSSSFILYLYYKHRKK